MRAVWLMQYEDGVLRDASSCGLLLSLPPWLRARLEAHAVELAPQRHRAACKCEVVALALVKTAAQTFDDGPLAQWTSELQL